VEMDITELCKDSLDLAIPSLMDTTLTQGFWLHAISCHWRYCYCRYS
jgi:hypothetical protein